MASVLQSQCRLPSCCRLRHVFHMPGLRQCINYSAHSMEKRVKTHTGTKKLSLVTTALPVHPFQQISKPGTDAGRKKERAFSIFSRLDWPRIHAGKVLVSVSLAFTLLLTSGDVGKAVEYVSPNIDQMQAMAKPFKRQEVNKGRIWLLFVLGASSLFGVTILVENNGAWFPAIAKANKAMKASMKAMEARERQEAINAESVSNQIFVTEEIQQDSLQDAVLAGIRQASQDAKKTLSTMKDDVSVPAEIGIDDDIGSLLDVSVEDNDDEDSILAEGQGEDREERTPLFEISGDDIDQSIENRNEARQQEEVEDDDDDLPDDSSTDVSLASPPEIDLSAISLDDLQKELEKRKNRQS